MREEHSPLTVHIEQHYMQTVSAEHSPHLLTHHFFWLKQWLLCSSYVRLELGKWIAQEVTASR